MTGTSPPGPLRCGSTTCSVNAVAAAASKALPPFSSTLMPTAVAIQCVEATTPKMPSISGRVVNGLGLILETSVFTGTALPQMAGHHLPRLHLAQGGGLDAAALDRIGAASVEMAARRRVDRARHVALQHALRPLDARVGHRHCQQELL